jgi:hypothetical protein
MDVNHETYNNNLRKIAFVMSFMATGSAATWKAQFIEEAYARPAPTNPKDRLGKKSKVMVKSKGKIVTLPPA